MSKSLLFNGNAAFTMIAVAVCVVFSQGLVRGPCSEAKTAVGDDAEERYRSGLVAFRAAKWPDALREFESAARDSTGYLRLCATNMVGQVQRLQGRAKDAQSAFGSMARQARSVCESCDPADAMARNAAVLELLALHYQAEIAQERQDWNAALSLYEQLLAMSGSKKEDFAAALCASPALLEKLGRLYWRTSRHDKAREVFTQSLDRWPTDSRAPLFKLALIALEDIQPSVQEPRLAFVICPIGKEEVGASQLMLSDGRVAAAMPKLPSPHNPMRDAVDRLLKELPPENVWRSVILSEMGWMLFEDGKLQESASFFTEASRSSGQAGASAWFRTIGNYADLSRAIICLRHGKLGEGKSLADGVSERRPQGHVQTLAGSIASSLARRQEAGRVGAKCAVQKLE